MSYLPIVVKKSRPFLEGLSGSGSSQRGVCPRGKLLAFVDPSGHLRVHLLSDDSQQVAVQTETFVGCQWVLPCRTHQDCVSDPRHQQKSELLAVSTSLDFHWFSVSEVEKVDAAMVEEGEKSAEDEEGKVLLTIESLAVLKKEEFCAELRKLECSDVIDTVQLLGSDNGQVLVLVNSLLMCRLTMDSEFDRLAFHDCMVLEMSFDPYDDDNLPQRAGLPVSFAFRSPLLFAMNLDGIVFIYNINTAVCIGIVSATQYCQYACGRQPDSEELLSTISASHFCLTSVSPDLTHLVASTYDNNLLFINLPEYFQVFSDHYHPGFVRAFQKTQLNDQAASIKASDISQEEVEDQAKYGGVVTTPTGYWEKPAGDFTGQHTWTNRLGKLKQSVTSFQPSEGRYLSFYQSSTAHPSSAVALTTSKYQLHGKNSVVVTEKRKVEVQPSLSNGKAWYEEPISLAIATNRSTLGSWENAGTTFVTGMKKSISEHRPSIGSHTSVTDALPLSQYSYKNYCVLPSASYLLENESTVVHVEFASGLVVAFYGDKEGEGKEKDTSGKISQRQFVDGHGTAAVTGVALYNTSSLTYSVRRLPQASWVIPSCHPDQLLCLANEQSLTVATFNLSQEEFVGKVLMYGNASIAEEVCQLNRWDNCSLPINALETALELRQLDTLAFFLRSRETDTATETEANETSQAQKLDQSEAADEALYLPPLPPDQLDTVVKLLIDAIHKNYKEEHYCQFASHLLIMTLGFLTRMIKNQTLLEEHFAESASSMEAGGVEAKSAISPTKRTFSGNSLAESLPEISVSSLVLAGYVHQLRSYLPKARSLIDGQKAEEERGREVSERETSSRSDATDFMDRSITSRWERQKPKEVIRDALLRGCLPLAQSYLIQRVPQEVGRTFGRSISLMEAIDDYSGGSAHYNASLDNMMTIATGFVIEALEKKSIKQASSILTQMGLNVRSSLRYICFHTLSRELRDFLANDLISREWLSDEELQTLEYLHILERFYPHESYEQAHSAQPKQSRHMFQSTSLPAMPGMVSRPTSIPSMGDLTQLYPETFGGDHALGLEPVSVPSSKFDSRSSSPLYLQVPLAVVLNWDLPTRQRLLFEGLVLSGQADGLDCEKLVNKEYVFNYYVRHNDITGAVQFVTSRVPPLENPTPCPAQILSLSSNMPHSTRYLGNTLLDELARHGVFLDHELNCLPNLLTRLGRVHSLFSQPHPLTKTGHHQLQVQDDSVGGAKQNEEGRAILSVEDFHKRFLQYLVENRFFSLMYHYLDSYGLGLDDESISALGLDSSNQQPWVQVMLQYRRAGHNPNDPTVMFHASLSCGNLLLSTSPNGTPGGEMTVMKMLREGRTLMAIATLMYAPVPVEEAMNIKNSHQPWYVEPNTFRRAIAAYPSLQAAIFPPPPTSVTPAQSQDISLYHLLQGNVSFNISRLFRWQSNNTLATHHDDSVDNFREVPHFSSPALMEKYALTEHLNYIYYLRRGQPSFAYANFVAAKLIGHSNTTKRIDRAVSHVYRLALLDFTNAKLTSSCAAFIEMLDRDSTLLRVDTQAALRIARYSGDGEGKDHSVLSKDGCDKHRRLAMQFIQLFQNTDSSSLSSSLLEKLVVSTHNMVETAGIEICGLEAEECWSLVQSFTHSHNQPPSLAFVTLCAKQGEWLPLLCHAEIYKIPPSKIMGIVEHHFSNPYVKEHLQQAISAMERDQLHTPTSPKADGTFERRSKRKRIGSASRSTTKIPKIEATVTQRPDVMRAKFYSKVGLQREVTPQAEPPPTGSEEPVKMTEGGESVATSISIDAASPAQEREVVFLPPALEEEGLPGDLFSVLFKCEAHDTPWKALLAHAIALQRPLLAVLAACYEEASVVDCMCVWLYSSLGPQVMERATAILGMSSVDTSKDNDRIRFTADLQWQTWSPFKLGLLLISAMQHSPSPAAVFTQAFTYFDDGNPLLSFLRFYEEFVLRSNYEECRNHLQEFNLSTDKALGLGYYGGSIGDLFWVQQVASLMASHMLMICPTPFERSHLLRLLAEAQFGNPKKFKCLVLNFNNLHQMSLVLSEAGLASDAAFTVKEQFSTTPGLSSLPEVYSVRVRVNTDHVLGLLLEKEQFNIARKYAELVNSTSSQISIKEAEHNLKKISQSSYWHYQQARLNFWYQCDANFQNASVDADLASEFFESVVHSLSEGSQQDAATNEEVEDDAATSSQLTCSAKDRALLLALALKWRKESKTQTVSAEQLRVFEREIWVEHIRASMESNTNVDKKYSSPLPFLPDVEQTSSILPLYNQSSLLSSLSISALEEYKGRRLLSELLLQDSGPVALEKKGKGSTLTDKECEAFDQILGRLLNAGLLTQARELADIFRHNSADLTIVLCCIQLAMGKLKPDQLTESVLSLVSARSPQQLSDSSLLTMADDSQQNRPSAEMIKMMVSLSDRAIYAQQCCTTIIVCFRLAVALKMPYASVIMFDPFETLTKLLSSKLSEKYQLASKFVSVCNLEPSEVAGFISNKVAEALQSSSDSRDPAEAQVYNSKMTTAEFAELAKLCRDPNVLGGNLLSMAKTLSDHPTPQKSDLSIQVEFLIRAHDCYTLGCSVGGIADLLITAQSTTNKLVAGKYFKLMVRLLIGIARFKEMSYIIGLLMQHDEFESLLSYKGTEKKEQLRIAIMDYLNHHSGLKEKEKLERLQLVALKFKMFREVAKVKEQQALRELKKIKPKNLAPGHPETVKNLKNVFEGLKAAAKFYSQENCLASAEQCYSMARLVALQLSVVQNSKQVINLDARGVLTQMEELPFNEALIVADAYKQTMWIDWVSPLYRKVVVRGDFQYFVQYKLAFPLQPSFFQEIASKYMHDRDRPPEAATNMRKLLDHLKNLPLKKLIAEQLGMSDVLQSLSATYKEGFLSDVAQL